MVSFEKSPENALSPVFDSSFSREVRLLTEAVDKLAKKVELRSMELKNISLSKVTDEAIFERVKLAYDSRKARDAFFERDFFADPAWDLMLFLTIRKFTKDPPSVTAACIAARVPPTTALRHIARLTGAGLIIRDTDLFDPRRAFLSISDEAFAKMKDYFRKCDVEALSGL